jgi:hypothetical protein
MSRIASAGVSRVMIMPGAITAPPTSCAPMVRLTCAADQISPAMSARVVSMVTAAISARVTLPPIT